MKILASKSKILPFDLGGFFRTFVILLFIGAVPGLIQGNEFSLAVAVENAGWYFIYWFVIAALVSVYSTVRKYRAYDRPIAALSEASKKVAAGDFSIYIDPNLTKKSNPYLARMTTDFNVMVKELGSLETLKSDLVSNVSHELKTPLAVIKNYAETLESAPLTEAEKKEHLEVIIKAADELTDTITNILLLNKLENQGIIPKSQPYNLVTELSEVILSFESLFDEKELRVQVELEDRALVDLDRNLLNLVWRNILANAIKFSHNQGEILIGQTSTSEHIIVEISDTGVGMDSHTLQHLFDKFYQGDSSRKQLGNGLGLALVKQVLELLQAEITCYSELGQGSRFIVKLPSSKE